MKITLPEGALQWMFGAFLLTFLVSRFVTARIRSGRGRLSDLEIGDMHIHHMVWGVGLMLVFGTATIAFRPAWPLDVAPAIGFGAGAALVLDEFALLLYVRDVYWAEEGWSSLAAVGVMAVVVGMIAMPLAPSSLPHHSLPVVVALVSAYVLFTMICLAKGKLFTSLIGLFVPYAVVFGGLRLARPNSPWARVWYRRNPRRMRRALARYNPAAARERRRQRVLELISGTRLPAHVPANQSARRQAVLGGRP